jgi:hypothetical protein
MYLAVVQTQLAPTLADRGSPSEPRCHGPRDPCRGAITLRADCATPSIKLPGGGRSASIFPDDPDEPEVVVFCPECYERAVSDR